MKITKQVYSFQQTTYISRRWSERYIRNKDHSTNNPINCRCNAQIIWKRRGFAALRARLQKCMFPMLRKMRSRLFDHLEAELAALGEEQFLQRWSTRFIRVVNKQIEVSILPYWLLYWSWRVVVNFRGCDLQWSFRVIVLLIVCLLVNCGELWSELCV